MRLPMKISRRPTPPPRPTAPSRPSRLVTADTALARARSREWASGGTGTAVIGSFLKKKLQL
jgi:hypothetical protein